LGGNWIVKLPDQRFDRVSEDEFSMMTFATKVGIDVPAIGLVDPNDVAGLPEDIRNLSGKAFYIERFDRMPQGGRIHTEDFAQANALYPAQKYSFFNFDMLAEQVAVHLGGDAALDLIRRIVFNVGIGNGDMHAKNWSVIYRDGRTPSLAPAYDYVSTVVYMPRDDIGMNLAGTKSFGAIDDDRLVRLANHARLPRKPVLDAAHDMVDRMRETWPTIESDLPMSVEHPSRSLRPERQPHDANKSRLASAPGRRALPMHRRVEEAMCERAVERLLHIAKAKLGFASQATCDEVVDASRIRQAPFSKGDDVESIDSMHWAEDETEVGLAIET